MTIIILAARIVLGNIDTQAVIAEADALLESELGRSPDTKSDYLVQLATSKGLTNDEVHTLLHNAFGELGLKWPPFEEAVDLLLTDWMTRIAQGQVKPRQAGHSVYYEVFQPLEHNRPTKRYVGDGFGLADLFATLFAYDDLGEQEASLQGADQCQQERFTQLDNRMIELACEWLDRYGVDLDRNSHTI